MRMALTTPQSLSVPMCGFASMRMSCGAPKRTKVRRICSPRGSFVPVLSLPSENVPAPALAELHVGRRGESLRTARPVSVNVAGADIHILTALKHDGACACFGQRQRGEQPGRAETDDNRADGGCTFELYNSGRRVRRGQSADGGRQPRGNALFILRIFERHIQGDDETNVVFFARIDALFTDFTTLDSALRNAKRLGRPPVSVIYCDRKEAV